MPVSVERSDVIDAVAGLMVLADKTRREAKQRRNGGAKMAGYRAHLRKTAAVYDDAAKRMQRAADEAA